MLRAAVRDLTRDLRFLLLAVTLLAVTIGATIAVYAIVHAVVLRPLLFRDQDRVAVVWQRDLRRDVPVIEIAHDEMVDWRRRSQTFEDLAVMGSVNWSVTLAGQPDETVPLSAVSASFFSVLGTAPAIGRPLQAADEIGSTPQVMVISHGLWVRRFGADRAIVGRTADVRWDAAGPSVPIEIVGVMPQAFDFPRGADVWMSAAPLVRGAAAAFGGTEQAMLSSLAAFYIVGRLAPGVTFDAATRELTRVMRTSHVRGGLEPPAELVVMPIVSYLLGPAEPVLWALLAGAVLMLLIACVNVGGLQVMRAARRARAMAIHLALGASNRRLVLQTVLQSGIVSATALAGAGVAAFGLSRILIAAAPAEVPRIDELTLVGRPVVAFGGVAVMGTIALCALWPAFVASRMRAMSALVQARSASAVPAERHVHRAVVIAQIAIALTLLAGTSLFVRTVRGLDRTMLGFDPEHLLAVQVTPGSRDIARWNASYEALIDRVSALPGVDGAGAVSLRPLSGPIGLDTQPLYPGQRAQDHSTWELNPYLSLHVTTPDYFRTMRMRLVRGRFFAPADTSTAPAVALVSESAARRLWPGQDPIGQLLRESAFSEQGPDAPPVWRTIVGVVGDVRYRGLNDVRLDLYLPAAQVSTLRVHQLMVRTTMPAGEAVSAIRAAAHAIDPSSAVSDAAVMSSVVESESAPWRFLTRVFVAFASLAAVLSALGLGALVALAVSSRRRELAIRAALGADRRRLRSAVFGEARSVILIGSALGLVGALALGRGVSTVLVGVAPHDPAALASAAGLVIAVALAACWWPGRRAASVNPVEALRQE